LMKNLRRSIRKYVSIPLKLLYEVTGHNWIEESRTLEVSLHGASIECRIPIAKGEMMTVERVDNHKRAQVKVRWHRRKADGSQMLGIELLDSNDFWEFNRAFNEVRRQEA
jgi:PilZ domain